jgi:uncharacterized protein YndB with AHSA1/START domain
MPPKRARNRRTPTMHDAKMQGRAAAGETSLTLVRQIAAPPALVWEMLVTPDGLREWIGPDAGPVLVADVEPHEGGSYRFRFRTIEGSEHEASGRCLAFEPLHRLVMSWSWLGDNDNGGESEVEFELAPADDGTRLTLTHRGLSDEASRDGHALGWTGSLDKLVAALGRDPEGRPT